MNVRFWKLSQGGDDFVERDVLRSIEQRLVYVHDKTGPKGGSASTQGEDFVTAPVGDYFYLTYGNKGVYLLGQLSGPANIFSSRGRGWLDRPFRFILPAVEVRPYSGPDKWWAPNHPSTFTEMPSHELGMFEEVILWPHFAVRLAQFGVSGGVQPEAGPEIAPDGGSKPPHVS